MKLPMSLLQTVKTSLVFCSKVKESARERSVIVPSEAKEDLIKELNAANVQIETKDIEKNGIWLSMISSFLLPVIIIAGFLFMVKKCSSLVAIQAMSFRRSRAKLMMDNKVRDFF